MHDHLWINARLVTCTENDAFPVIEDGALAARDGRIAWVGATDDLPEAPAQFARRVTNVRGRTLLPGLIDCHTHLVFGGHRAAEYEQRLAGASYEEIARSGGGIASTVQATRGASDELLLATAMDRAQQMLAEGVTCIEIKSGYGLTLEHEARMLRVARRLGRELPLKVVTTFLGAHALPIEFSEDRDGYIDLVCREMLPSLADEGLIDAVDGYCESIGFSAAEIERVFDAATALDLPVKLHAEQLSNCGGSALAARYGALSVDHLEYLDESGAAAIAASGTVAVLLPGAYHTLRDSRPPPVDLLRQHQVPMAVASDANPGTSPVLSLRLMTNLACQLFGLTVAEAVRGVTINAARALGMSGERGSLAVGHCADLVICDIETPAELPYWLGGRIVDSVVTGGEVLDL